MERSRKVFLKIASAANKVIISANDYADRKDKCGVKRAHFQLETDMRRIAVACECIADFLTKSTLPDRPEVDVRLQDWLDSEEPQECLDTLLRMKTLLQVQSDAAPKSSLWFSRAIPWIFDRGSSTVHTGDKIAEAAEDFSSRKVHFHFLFSTDIWNDQRTTEQQQGHIRVAQPASSGLSQTEIKGVSSPSLLHTTHENEQADHVVHNDLGSVDDNSPQITIQQDNDATPNVVDLQSGHTIAQGQRGISDDEQNAKNLKEMIEWLDGLNCTEKHDDTLLLRQPDTCKWLFDTTNYNLWRDDENSFLWLKGKPGAGKSVLASSVIDSLRGSLRKGEILTFFYCDFRNERSTYSTEVLRSILSQVLRKLDGSIPKFGSLLQSLVEAKERGGNTLKNPMELARLVSHAAGSISTKPLAVIDALDECKDVNTLIHSLKELKGCVRLFVTSRPLNIIAVGLAGLPFISMGDMEDEVAADIRLHIDRELDARHRLRGLPVMFKDEIRTALCAKACGMFRWVQCSLDTLNGCANRTEVRLALDSLPEGLDETYERILSTINEKGGDGQLARRALAWMVAAFRPLQLIELMEGLTINPRTRILDADLAPMHSGVLLDICGSLVTYSEKTGVITLSHFSVKEYLVGTSIPTRLALYNINTEHAHLELVQLCMCYLLIYLNTLSGSINPNDLSATNIRGISLNIRDRLRILSHPLLYYALNHAIDHFRHLGSQFKFIIDNIQHLANAIQHHRCMWDNLCRSTTRDADPITPTWPISKHDLMLYVLVAYAPKSLLKSHIRRTSLAPKHGMNPLIYAAYFNKQEHAQTLLLQGVGLNHKGWGIQGHSQVFPIEVALENRHYAVATLFIRHESVVPSHIFTRSFLRSYGPIPSHLARILFQTDYLVEAANDSLHKLKFSPSSIFEGVLGTEDSYEDDLIAILRRCVQVLGHDYARGEELVNFAVGQGLYSFARHLLSCGPASLPFDLLISGRWGIRTAKIVHFLVENGVNIHMRNATGDPVLCVALQSFHSWEEDAAIEVIKALVDYGYNPLEATHSGSGLLDIAVELGFASVARYLFSLSVSSPLNLLSCAFKLPRQTMVPMIVCLLENGTDAHAPTPTGDPLLLTILRTSSKNDALNNMKALIDCGCDPLETTPSGQTLLHVAVELGFISVTRYLFSLGILPPSDLLHHAFESWHWNYPMLSMVICLLENGANVHARTPTGYPLLHMVLSASSKDDALDNMKALIDCGCDPLETTPSGQTLLHVAVELGFVSVTRYLFSLGIPPPSDVLHYAFKSWHWNYPMPSMVICLLENGANAHARTPTGYPLLHTVLSASSEDDTLHNVKALIDYGCDPLETTPSGQTLLHVAVELGFVSVTRYLFSLSIPPPFDLLHHAFKSRHWNYPMLSMIICLLENGANVHARTPTGYPLLHTVLSTSSEDDTLHNVKALIDCGCDPLETTPSGQTLLHATVKLGFVSVTRYLFSLGIPPPSDLLHHAFESKHWNYPMLSMIICLLENGANVHARTPTGYPLLHTVLSTFSEDDTLHNVKALIDYGCDPLETTPSGQTLLHATVRLGFISVTRYLFSLGASPSPDLLQLALEGGLRRGSNRLPMVICLVENGADVHALTPTGDPLLHTVLSASSEYDALDNIKAFIDYGFDPFETTPAGKTLLHVSVEHGLVSGTRYLLSLGTPPSPGLLHRALATQCSSAGSVILCLLENGVDVRNRSPTGDTALHAALQEVKDEPRALHIAELLVSHGCSPFEANLRGETPLYIAVRNRFLSVVRYLLGLLHDAPIPPDLLLVALRSRPWRVETHWGSPGYGIEQRLEILELLLDNKANFHACHTASGSPPFRITWQSLANDDNKIWIDNELPKVLELLVRHGYNPFEYNSDGKTLLCIENEQGIESLMECLLSLDPCSSVLSDVLQVVLPSRSLRDKVEVIKRLLLKGANVHAKTPGGDSLLHYAIVCMDWNDDDMHRVVECFLAFGACPTMPNDDGTTPFHFTVERGYLSIVASLVRQHNIQPPCGILFTAIDSTDPTLQDVRLDMVRVLVSGGASTEARDASGRTPLEAAVCRRRYAVFEYLKSLRFNQEGGHPLGLAGNPGSTSLLSQPEQEGLEVREDATVTLPHRVDGCQCKKVVPHQI